MERAAPKDDPLRDDILLLVAQSERCRAILKELTSLSSSSEEHVARLPLLSLVEEVSAPHRNFGIDLRVEPGRQERSEPVMRRNAGVVYGLGNIVENAVDFAEREAVIRVDWSDEGVRIVVTDDGPGFSPEALFRIGDPYMSERASRERKGGGLGLGLFIAKTLLERSGAALTFGNRPDRAGASVEIFWPNAAFQTQVAPPAPRVVHTVSA